MIGSSFFTVTPRSFPDFARKLSCLAVLAGLVTPTFAEPPVISLTADDTGFAEGNYVPGFTNTVTAEVRVYFQTPLATAQNFTFGFYTPPTYLGVRGAEYGHDMVLDPDLPLPAGGTMLRPGLVRCEAGSRGFTIRIRAVDDYYREAQEAFDVEIYSEDGTRGDSIHMQIHDQANDNVWVARVIRPVGAIGARVDVRTPLQGNITDNGVLRSFSISDNLGLNPRVALADFNGDGLHDIVLTSSAYSVGIVRIIDFQTGQPIREWFTEGVETGYGSYVATGDVNGDGFPEIVTGNESVETVRVWDMKKSMQTGGVPEVMWYYAVSPNYGSRVACADVNGDGYDDVILSRGAGTYSYVLTMDVRNNTSLPAGTFFPYDFDFHGGAYVTAGDITGDGRPEIILGAGEGGGPHMRVWSTVNRNFITDYWPVSGAENPTGIRIAVTPKMENLYASLFYAAPSASGYWERLVYSASPTGAPNVIANNYFGTTASANGQFLAAANSAKEPLWSQLPTNVPQSVLTGPIEQPNGWAYFYTTAAGYGVDVQLSSDLQTWTTVESYAGNGGLRAFLLPKNGPKQYARVKTSRWY